MLQGEEKLVNEIIYEKNPSCIISALMTVSLAACGSQSADKSGSASGTSENLQSFSGNTEAESTFFAPSEKAFGKKVLVVYFSATGNTKEAAESIASATGGDLFELIPVKPYSSEDLNWNNENSRVIYEHDHPTERTVALTAAAVDNFEEYDTVFIGYP
ncbi:MAG: flavodoxin [Faecousia sp.]